MLLAQLAVNPVPQLRPMPPVYQPQAGMDFSNMPIEDAVMLMFGMLADDARADTRAMLEEMQQARTKRAAMREAQDAMTKELVRLKALEGGKAMMRINPTAVGQRQWVSQLSTFCGKLSGEARAQCLEGAVRKRTMQLQALPSPK
jgi:hypothetical protein